MPARAIINLQALRYNYRRAAELSPMARVMPVIKARAYGHGMTEVAYALDQAEQFAVATLDEALLLRANGLSKKILVLQGVNSKEQLLRAAQEEISLVVHQQHQVALLESVKLPGRVNIWIKLDTGMHRLGFKVSEFDAIYQRCNKTSNKLNLHVLSHFANADDPDDPLTNQQLDRFLQTTRDCKAEKSIANSAAICGPLDCQLDWVRPGIMLYGVHPMMTGTASELSLKPVMSLYSHLIAIHHRKRGDRIGYGGDWTCTEDMPVGIISIGYGDGYPRHAPSGTPVLIQGKRVSLVGRVSMDMICVDLRSCPDAKVGDEATLWGEGLPVEDIARAASTIAYELLCRLTGRVKFIYT
jgi:alanine racemase